VAALPWPRRCRALELEAEADAGGEAFVPAGSTHTATMAEPAAETCGALTRRACYPDAHWRILLAETAPTPTLPGAHAWGYLAIPGVDHYTAAVRSAAAAAGWLAERFAEHSPPDDCAALQ